MSEPRHGDEVSDKSLARRVQQLGCERSFRALYRRHTPSLRGVLERRIRIEGIDSDDIVQDTWIRAVEGLATFRWSSSFRTWLMSIGLNRVRELERRALRRKTETREAPDRPVSPPPTETGIDLQRAMAELPAGYRTVLTLHDIEGHTHPEISERLDIAVGTSRSQLHHARRAMRRFLTRGDRKDE